MPGREVFTRGHLPHWYVPGAVHFVTYRLAGTIPKDVVERLHAQREARLQKGPPEGVSAGQFRERVHKQFFAAYDRYLDRVGPLDWLAKPEVAAIVRGNLYHHAGHKYHLLAYCVMPNHVHGLLQPTDSLPSTEPRASDEVPDASSPLAKIMHSLKSYTANQANALLRRSGQFWQHESYDHWVRDEDELERIVDYIAWNPVKAGLVAQPHEWFFGSAHDRFLQDGSRCGFLPWPAPP
jgi:putative transposase